MAAKYNVEICTFQNMIFTTDLTFINAVHLKICSSEVCGPGQFGGLRSPAFDSFLVETLFWSSEVCGPGQFGGLRSPAHACTLPYLAQRDVVVDAALAGLA